MTLDEAPNEWGAITGCLSVIPGEFAVDPRLPCADQTKRMELEVRAKVAPVFEAMRLNPDSYSVLFALQNPGDVRLAGSGTLVDCGRLAVLMARTSSIEEACADRLTYSRALVPELVLRARMLLVGFPEDAMPVVVAVA